LGDEQSGHIKEVGYELYQQMLEEAVEMMKAGITEPVSDQWSPQITLGVPVTIPEDYVADLNVRLALYRRLADLEDDTQIEAVAAEMVDRFGPLPPEVDQLLKIVAIKALCRRANVEKVDAGPKGVVIAFRDNTFKNTRGLMGFILDQGPTAKVRPDQRILFLRDFDKVSERLKGTMSILRSLAKIAARAEAA
jgi:transcription-repair coupling factor (superfamily II helicase)